MSDDLTIKVAKLCQDINDIYGSGQRISYLDILDALATAGLTLTVDEANEASRAYAAAVEMEGLWVA